MTDFTLDTSGAVVIVEEFAPGCDHVKTVEWSDLNAFRQGYVEALFAANRGALTVINMASCVHRDARFSDLSPEALAMILADCARFQRRPGCTGANSEEDGASFWHGRQTGCWPDFPPLTVSLGDDGKVNLGVAK